MSDDVTKVCLGKIVGAKGLRGEIRVKSFTEYPEDIAAYGPVTTDDGRTLALSVSGTAKGVVVATVEGVEDRTAADALKGLNLFVDRSALPPPGADALYQADLVGLHVERTDGQILGKVTAFHNFGAGDMMEVEKQGGAVVLVPFTEAAIAEVDMDKERILVSPLPGLFDDVEAGESAGSG